MLYSNKENVNILTALLVTHGIHHAVVCPGSRNAPIVHNLNEHPNITCYAVTDERSAGFYALGIAQMLAQPVVVCVTSGTALLNVMPAVAEAYYQHIPLVVISADRPTMWVDQQEGQTLPQLDALGYFVEKAVALPEPTSNDERWYCNRLVNEALLYCKRKGGSPVHINIPIAEPLFIFNVPALPMQRHIQLIDATYNKFAYAQLEKVVQNACRLMIVVGQLSSTDAVEISKCVEKLDTEVVILHECLSIALPQHIDKLLQQIQVEEANYMPDTIIYVGGTLISKKLKQFLRRCVNAKTWIINKKGDIYDTFQNLQGVIEGCPATALACVYNAVKQKNNKESTSIRHHFNGLWKKQIVLATSTFSTINFPYSQLLAVKILFQQLSSQQNYILHAANSMSIRLVNLFAKQYVFCNRGVNGIEGSLSAAAGCSLVTNKTVYCVIGDLSFFYDENALWHQLKSNFRVLLLNNSGGGIFQNLPGLQQSAAHQPYIAAQHRTSAYGICEQNKVAYLCAHNQDELQCGMQKFVSNTFQKPLVFEVFTTQQQDEQAMSQYKIM